jgi:hypothetical protein
VKGHNRELAHPTGVTNILGKSRTLKTFPFVSGALLLRFHCLLCIMIISSTFFVHSFLTQCGQLYSFPGLGTRNEYILYQSFLLGTFTPHRSIFKIVYYVKFLFNFPEFFLVCTFDMSSGSVLDREAIQYSVLLCGTSNARNATS